MEKKLMNCTRCEICGTASMIYTNPFVEYSILYRLLAAPLASMGVSLLCAAVLKSPGIHTNSKILLVAMSIAAIVCNIGILGDALYKFLISNVLPDIMQCDYQVFYPQYFIAIRNVQEVGCSGFAVSGIILAIERTIATVFYRNYGKTSELPILGLVLVIIQLLCCIIPVIHIKVPKQMYPYSPPEIQNYSVSHYFSMFLTLTTLLAVLMFAILWIVNRYRAKLIGTSHLQIVLARYELADNISTTRLMAPVIVIISLMVFSSEFIYALFMPQYDSSTVVNHDVLNELVDYAPIAEYQLSLISTLSIILVIMMPACCEKLKESFLCVSHLSICFRKPPTDSRSSSESSDVYFAKYWNKKRSEDSQTPDINYY
ncbi:unnamed protein product [Caenorhabditis bovis]|uniref:G-protein coupled receptors family 1 profile domain-containing protein n=1 Tax=Caenorhabditis bovis TaxID=2654633 RepID=A0A8S1F9D2_9PELO|nr:unnamed protein product [Caenorhabditis bovis]